MHTREDSPKIWVMLAVWPPGAVRCLVVAARQLAFDHVLGRALVAPPLVYASPVVAFIAIEADAVLAAPAIVGSSPEDEDKTDNEGWLHGCDA